MCLAQNGDIKYLLKYLKKLKRTWMPRRKHLVLVVCFTDIYSDLLYDPISKLLISSHVPEDFLLARLYPPSFKLLLTVKK